MKRFFKKKFITAVLFIIIIFSFSIANFMSTYNGLEEDFKVSSIKNKSVKYIISEVDDFITDKLLGKNIFIEGYGFLQKLMGKNEESNFEVIKDKKGFMHYTFFGLKPNSVYEIAERTEALKSGLNNKKTKFIYIMPPDKYIRGYTKMPKGVPYNYANETADNFLDILSQKNIDFIDTRSDLSESGIHPEDLFFKTDHHWKIESAFFEYGKIVDTLNEKYNMKIDADGYYRDRNNYNFITYKNSFLGSMGRKTGIIYGGVDDFTLIYPKFKTSYSYDFKTNEFEMKLDGSFEEALLNIGVLKSDKGIYSIESDKYSSYLYGNQAVAHITNKYKPKGPKILFIKDSYSVPLAAFLSTVCSDVYLIDPRYYDKDIPQYINDINNLDVVFLSFAPQDLTAEFFNFYKEYR